MYTIQKHVCLFLFFQIRTTFTSELGITSSHDEKRVYHPDLTRETVQWRKFLRSTHYLERPCEEKEMPSISGQILDIQLVKFAEHCKGKRECVKNILTSIIHIIIENETEMINMILRLGYMLQSLLFWL